MNPSVMTDSSKRFRPGLVIAIIGCVLLAVGIFAKHRGAARLSTAGAAAESSRAAAQVQGGGPSAKQRAPRVAPE